MNDVLILLLGISSIAGGLAIMRLHRQTLKLANRLLKLIKLTTEIAEELNQTKTTLAILKIELSKKGDK